MLRINPNQLSDRERYKLLIGSIIPRPVALVSTLSKERVINLAPISYFNIVSATPPIVSLSVSRRQGKMKDTAKHLLNQKEAVIHIIDTSIINDANETAVEFSEDKSELSVTNFSVAPSKIINTPGINEAKIRFETSLYDHIEIKEQDQVSNDLFLLKLEQYYIEEAIFEEGKIDPLGLDPISRLAGSTYATLGKLFDLERP